MITSLYPHHRPTSRRIPSAITILFIGNPHAPSMSCSTNLAHEALDLYAQTCVISTVSSSCHSEKHMMLRRLAFDFHLDMNRLAWTGLFDSHAFLACARSWRNHGLARNVISFFISTASSRLSQLLAQEITALEKLSDMP